MTDQQHGRDTGDDSTRGQGQAPDQGKGADKGSGSGDQTVVFPSVAWPSAEPDAGPQHDPAHIDYLDTPSGPVQAPPHGVFTADQSGGPKQADGRADPAGGLFTPVVAADPPGGLFTPAREVKQPSPTDGPTAELKTAPPRPAQPAGQPSQPGQRNGGSAGAAAPGQRDGAGDERTSTIGDRTARRNEQTARSNDTTSVIGDSAALRAALDGPTPSNAQNGAPQGRGPNQNPGPNQGQNPGQNQNGQNQNGQRPNNAPPYQGSAAAQTGLITHGAAAERTGLIDRSNEQTGLMSGRGVNDRTGLMGYGQDDRTGLVGYAHDEREASGGGKAGWRSRLPSASSPAVRRGLFVAAGVFGLMVLLYGADLLMASGEVPRGVLVAGVDVGGMGKTDAEQRLRDEIGSRLDAPVSVRAGDVDATVNPRDAGLALNWPATLEQAGDQPLNPWTRLSSLFGSHEVGIVSETDDAKLTAAVEGLRSTVEHEPAEGSITFEGTTPVGVDPKQGQTLDVPGAVDALTRNWAAGGTVELPVATTPVRSTPETVRAALDGIAAPAVAGPVTITGEGAEATITPELVASVMTFEVGADGTLSPLIDVAKLTEALKPQLADTEKEGKDATIAIQGGAPVVTPSVDGRGVDWAKSLTELPNVLRSKDNRTLPAVYGEQPAKFTTDQANAMGVKEVVAEFTTRGFATDSGVNIRQMAAEVNGATVKPGETFSLNTHTGPRGLAQGYVEAGIIDKGRPGRAVGGGASQFATTLFNATYFAGMTDVAHKEHSYFISRYPEAREATVFEGVIDLVFKNDSPSGILIETAWTPSSITVRIWSTKHYEVESVTGGRSNATSPNTVVIPHGEKCSPGSGAGGFTVSNTRIVKDARTKAEIKRNSRTAVYNPVPKVECAPAPGTTPPPGG